PGWTGGMVLVFLVISQPLMVVHDLDVEGVGIAHRKQMRPSIVDANAVSSLAITCEGLQAIAWNDSKDPRGPLPHECGRVSVSPLEQYWRFFRNGRTNSRTLSTPPSPMGNTEHR